jgi:hypothetical protein
LPWGHFVLTRAFSSPASDTCIQALQGRVHAWTPLRLHTSHIKNTLVQCSSSAEASISPGDIPSTVVGTTSTAGAALASAINPAGAAKLALLEVVAGLDRGALASPADKQRVEELVRVLESQGGYCISRMYTQLVVCRRVRSAHTHEHSKGELITHTVHCLKRPGSCADHPHKQRSQSGVLLAHAGGTPQPIAGQPAPIEGVWEVSESLCMRTGSPASMKQ